MSGDSRPTRSVDESWTSLKSQTYSEPKIARSASVTARNMQPRSSGSAVSLISEGIEAPGNFEIGMNSSTTGRWVWLPPCRERFYQHASGAGLLRGEIATGFHPSAILQQFIRPDLLRLFHVADNCATLSV